MMELRGKVAIVTGAGSGLGAAISATLAEAGCRVLVADVRAEAAAAVASSLTERRLEAAGARVDVSSEAETGAAVERAIRDWGCVDVLVNNAGVDVTVPIEKLSAQQWDRILAVNLRGPFLMSKAVLPLMKARGTGHIVNVTSTAAKRAWANAAAYHASKWGLLGLSHAMHVEARPHGVKVTAVVSGGMRTPFLLERFPEIDSGLLQDPQNVADTVRYVLSQPPETVIPEVMVLPMRETSWP
ncbi:MAG TPA: SDR family oxidoreductase [Chloroflexota bacterium]|nr:SDR family oxidoreductase [Chloroflexota bacterium]